MFTCQPIDPPSIQRGIPWRSLTTPPQSLRQVRPRFDPEPAPTSEFTVSQPSPTDHTLRANPYPEVTDLFCRLPLPTLFYQLEAVHLGDLLRLSVRPGTKIILSLGFSRTVMTAPEPTASVDLYRTSDPISS